MMTLEEIRKKLADRRPGVVAEATGITAITIAEIRDGKRTNPKWETLEALNKYFEANK